MDSSIDQARMDFKFKTILTGNEQKTSVTGLKYTSDRVLSSLSTSPKIIQKVKFDQSLFFQNPTKTGRGFDLFARYV
ncbi:hypothetical protein CEXT_503461 [Caerostris extrusa]|uniref:Uncharacterized protein n=1 Tax=Caerostris extrusa TaxID=172846 RepID=A0AAV4V0A4_CAEEX|nr:hypothetical protein CEXT_503461 [Caerostris extrusa]